MQVRLVGYDPLRVIRVGGATIDTYRIAFESTYATGIVLSELDFRRAGGHLELVGLHAGPLPAPLEVLNAFTFRGKGTIHYLFILGAAGVLVVTVSALVTWFRRRKSLHHRWWWLLGILLGTFKFGLNWSTGAVVFQTLTAQIFSLGFVRNGYGPWMLWVSIPAGAIAFLLISRPLAQVAKSSSVI